MVDDTTDYKSHGGFDKNSWKTIRTLGTYLWEFRWRIGFALAFLIIAKIAIIGIPIALREIVDWFDESINPDPIVTVPIFLIIAYGALRLGSTLFEEFRNAVFARASQRSVRNIGIKVFNHLHELSHSFHQDRQTGGVSRDIERGTRGVNYLLFYLVFSVVPTAFEILAVCIFLAITFDPLYVVITGGTIFLYGWFTVVVTNWRTKFRVRMNAAETRANASSVDALLNFETVKYFVNEDHEAARFDHHLQEWEKESIKSELSLAVLNIGQGAIISAGLVGLLYLASVGIVNDILTLGDFVMLNAFLMQLYFPLRMLGSTLREINHALTDMDRMFTLLEVEEKLPEPEKSPELKITGPSIKFKDVEFHYNPQRPILRGVDLEIPAGHKVAVVGRSGAGKSTLVRLLFRFYDVTSGTIEIDGQDLREVQLKSLHRSIGIVPQDTVLFNDTIEYNIRYGRPECTEEEFRNAIRKAQLEDFIAALPAGLNTVVGERGLKLSGGEKQRVSIARTILKDPPILLLDEATSSLDSKSERLIQDALDVVSENRTTLVIAHRLSTVSDSDKIVVVDNGEVVEQGTHEELLALNGIYAEMWWIQLQQDDYEEGLDKSATEVNPAYA